MFWLLKERHRARRRLASPPAEWQQILQKNFALFPRLSPDDQRELLGHMQVFIAEKNFEGCAGLQMTDEIRVTIAAQACLLLLHRQTDYYPKLRSILVYPRAYLAESEERSGPLVHQYATERAGESWQIGAVVLAWDEVLDGASDPVDGYNVVFHEFAHQLDQAGTPQPLRCMGARPRSGVPPSAAAGPEREETFLDMYGATDPAEFFAVATEFFFESPHQLKKKHLALYEQLRQFYRQDPVRFVQAPAGDT
jgi:Mlc titration factor MtfA (ptsG expression regulator)